MRWQAAIEAHVESARHHKTLSKVVRAAKAAEEEQRAPAALAEANEQQRASNVVGTTNKPDAPNTLSSETAVAEGEAARLLRLQQMALGVFQGTGSASVAAGRMSGSNGGVHGTAHHSTFETLQNVRSKWIGNRGTQKSSNAQRTALPDNHAAAEVDADSPNAGPNSVSGAGMTMRAMRDRDRFSWERD
jgi:hypothetical protein